jgi:uncharacterized protein with PIN domain
VKLRLRPPVRWPSCEHSFVSAGAAHAAFKRAIERRHLAQAIAAAHDLPVVSLADALELVLLAADRDPPTFERAAARWLGRYCAEVPRVGFDEAGLVHAALTAAGRTGSRASLIGLLAVAKERQLRDVAKVLEHRLRAR